MAGPKKGAMPMKGKMMRGKGKGKMPMPDQGIGTASYRVNRPKGARSKVINRRKSS